MISIFGKNLIIMTFCLFVIVSCAARNTETDTPTTGDQAPLFETNDSDGYTWKLSDHLGKKFLVLYFFPAAMTGG